MRSFTACSVAILALIVVVRDTTIGQSPAREAVRPFHVHIDDAVLNDLQGRLAGTRFPDQVQNRDWEYGTELTYLRELVEYWHTEYDWRKHERALNRFHHFKTEVDGLDIHFIHQRSKEENALPLVLTHGWPGSFYEFLKIIPPLVDPVAHGGRPEDAFHIICPSLAGYAFSEKPTTPGYDPARMGAIVAKLMARLGYSRYVAQGGDWGRAVTTWLARHDTEHVAGIHLNLAWAGPPDGSKAPHAGVSPDELQRMEARREELRNHWGYGQIQGTRPQTLGYALNDSPVGLAAWIVDKFRIWSDCNGDLETSFTKDELLTNIMIYWVTESITSSMRIYWEARRAERGSKARVTIPTAVAVFPKEISLPPRRWVEREFNVTQWTVLPRGGHFAAFEEPKLFVADVRKFARTLRNPRSP
jgi:pimeloyl-ACP methyl ester carboxylesterase